MLRSKKELAKLEVWQLTLGEFGWVYPERLAQEHWAEVKAALHKRLPVPVAVLKAYPCFKKQLDKLLQTE